MHTKRFSAAFPHGSFAALLLASLGAVGCVADGSGDDAGIDEADVARESVTASNPLAGSTFYTDPYTEAARQEATLRNQGRIADANLIHKIASHPQGFWVGDWEKDPQGAVNNVVTRAGNQVPILVAYNIPGRDCGDFSSGGVHNAQEYHDWIVKFSAGTGSHKVVVILEPDALWLTAANRCAAVKGDLDVLHDAVYVIKSMNPNARVYIDAGSNGSPVSTQTIADALFTAAVGHADGFALNTSDSFGTPVTVAHGKEISALLAPKLGGRKMGFVIDTSRNGTGKAKATGLASWCNPTGLGLGKASTASTGEALVDAFLWVKTPGQSDGTCDANNPPAGTWFEARALEMARNANL